MLAVLYERERMHDDALILYQEMSRSYPRNYLLQYEVASLLCSLKRWQQGAQAYDDLLAARNVNSSDNEHVSRAKVLYQAGQAYEHLEQYEPALARYSQAQELPGNNRYIYASGLAAANLYEHLRLIQEARVLYQRVADATPGTEEGDAARRALRRLERN
jgi:tetratricopeptide (TPR) repeat protein